MRKRIGDVSKQALCLLGAQTMNVVIQHFNPEAPDLIARRTFVYERQTGDPKIRNEAEVDLWLPRVLAYVVHVQIP